MISLNLKTIQRFFKKIDNTGNCWEWKGTIQQKGYGQFGLNHKMKSAHRLSFELFKGEIPKGLQLDHLCRNRACVNPDHLEIVTNRENILRGIGVTAKKAKQTHCIHGHELSGYNLILRRDGRACRTCIYIRTKKYTMKKK